MTSGIARNEHGLTERQEKFVRYYVENGGNGTRAARDAGYPHDASHSRAWDCLQVPKVQARIQTLARELMASHAPACIKVLAELAVSSASDSVRLVAASTLLDRTGYKLPVVVEVSDHRTQADVDRELATLLGLDIQDEAVEEAVSYTHLTLPTILLV